MIFLDISCESPTENILLDDALLYLAERGKAKESLRIWESQENFIVLGRTSKVEEDINIEEACRDSMPILRRSSGGGTVLQGQGCLNYSLILSKTKHPFLRDLRQSYQYILSKVIAAIEDTGFQVKFAPLSDLVTGGEERKISGNAQKRGKEFILHHGTILYHFNLKLVEKYLKIPQDIPEYRRGRRHLDFLANLPAKKDLIRKSMKKRFSAEKVSVQLLPHEYACLQEFIQKKDVTVYAKDILEEASF